MFDIDHMLNGRVSSQHHQDLIQLVQQAKFAQDAQADHQGRKSVSVFRRFLISFMHVFRG